MKRYKDLLQEAISYTYKVPSKSLDATSLYDMYFWTMVKPLIPYSLEQRGVETSSYLGGEGNFLDITSIVNDAVEKIVNFQLST